MHSSLWEEETLHPKTEVILTPRVLDSHWDVAGLGQRSAGGTSKSLGPTEQSFRRRTEPARGERSWASMKSKPVSHRCKNVVTISSIF